ncbi:MAG: response regulator, partial [Prolixibacteraceae bacterium]|nr:response regulator [Prolixibacteraceae bacterium]
LEYNYDSTLFVGIDGRGVWQLDISERKVLNIYKENLDDPGSLRGNGVYDIYVDHNNRVWVCTYSDGLSYFDQASPLVAHLTHQINNQNSLVNNCVNSVIQDYKGRLWLATNNGISCWDRDKNQWKHFYANKEAQVFLTLCEDDMNRIWAGTYGSGTYVIDSDTGRELSHYSTKMKDSPVKNDYVFDIFKDKAGDIWIGGINFEVYRYITGEKRFQSYNAQPLYVFAEYENDQILLGCTYGIGITSKSEYNSRIMVNGFIVEDLLVEDSVFWVCTNGDGLIRYNPATQEQVHFTTANGLPSNFINSIVPVDDYFWLGTESGVCRFSPHDKSILAFSSINSLSSLSFNRNSICLLNDGQLALGSNNGLVVFDPHIIRESEHKGKIFIQDISITGRSIRDMPSLKLDKPVDKIERIRLKHNQNTISLELLPIGYVPGSKFSWKMEGIDEQWNPPTNNRIISYSNISSKNLKLYIRLYDSSLSHIIDNRVLLIDIKPPFWTTWYFFTIVFILVTAFFYAIFWYYINFLKQQHTEEKVRFFTNTAHDIRTSLTLIKAPVEELSKENTLSRNGRYFLNLAKEQVNRLSSVVTQLMDFQKVDIGRGQLVIRNIDVVKLIKNRVLMFESLASGRKIRLIFNTGSETFVTGIDEVKVEKIVDNLLSNAIKYSYPDSEVKINLNFSDTKWVLEVSDQGIGISKKEQKQLFREFFRGENAVNTKIVGSGIGLLLVRNYVSLMGGSVHCNSRENEGSVFEVSVPVRKVQAIGDLKEDLPQGLSEQPAVEGLDVSVNNASERRLALMRVLIVEDNEDLLQFIIHTLSPDFEVMDATNGERAWEIIQKEVPDLVISDIMMPKMDGFELCRLMKSTFETSHIPIILLTSLSGKTEQLQGLGLGADDYLTKPFDIALLKQKILTIIQNRNTVKEKALRLINAAGEETILANEHNDQFLKKMIENVHENISNTGFNKNDFASAMNVSPSLLYVKVKSLTGLSPTEFIKSVRMSHALELLQSNKYNVTEVSELCGFTSLGYFCTVFKKHFGKTPTEI